MDNGETLSGEACEPAHSWSVSLARTHPAKSVIVLCAFVVGSATVAALYNSVVYGLLSCAVLLGSTAAYWVPRRYSTYNDRIEVMFRLPIRPISYRWEQFRT